nr:transposase [Bacillus aquiflavi]
MIPIHKAIQNLFPHAQIIVDKYHVVQKSNSGIRPSS